MHLPIQSDISILPQEQDTYHAIQAQAGHHTYAAVEEAPYSGCSRRLDCQPGKVLALVTGLQGNLTGP